MVLLHNRAPGKLGWDNTKIVHSGAGRNLALLEPRRSAKDPRLRRDEREFGCGVSGDWGAKSLGLGGPTIPAEAGIQRRVGVA